MRFTQRNVTNTDTRTRPTVRTDLPDALSTFPPYTIRLCQLKNKIKQQKNLPGLKTVCPICSRYLRRHTRSLKVRRYFLITFAQHSPPIRALQVSSAGPAVLLAAGNIGNFLQLDFQLLPFRIFLRVNRKNIAFSLLAPLLARALFFGSTSSLYFAF